MMLSRNLVLRWAPFTLISLYVCYHSFVETTLSLHNAEHRETKTTAREKMAALAKEITPEVVTRRLPPQSCHISFSNRFFGMDPVVQLLTYSQSDDLTTMCESRFNISLTKPEYNHRDADIYMAHFRDHIDLSKLGSNTSINILYGVENAAFSPALANANMLQHFDYTVNSNIKTAAIPMYSIKVLPPSQGHVVPPYAARPNFAMFAWSHCEPVRTAYAKRMIDYSRDRHNLKVVSMAQCLRNDPDDTLDTYQTQSVCPDYSNTTHWEPAYRTDCGKRTMPDMAARTYKFSLVFLNADCDYWVDLRLATAWSSGSVVVFMGTSKKMLQEFIPPALLDAMMFVEDYSSPAHLVDAMVAMNETEFERRLAWTRGYDRSMWDRAHHGTEDLLCKLCRLKFDGSLEDGYNPPRREIRPDTCRKRRRQDWTV